MGYHRIMGYGCDFPLSQVGKRIFPWVIPGYGLREVCLKRESTVCRRTMSLGMMGSPSRRSWGRLLIADGEEHK
ncbi:hypothetical protein GY45DRAFT_530719 [Cubamyces sp. BRFM 1775]|nr:hypothetical protein GY45DRAFT_530719 [Cubamyces sp. BRFM 1775]